ncbi:MAG: bifunctional oligoribonuclease/PAP phosphatase NrnA [Bacteroidales bacterium]|nr:bifunctional oligoribonuclease/PAP phosphatase NrnA [Bacteroidales bacterium]MDY0217165.1 bifunctional oligoribonuclease/PAP phosphatase NrnA [Bacteroidales bacterium]
MLKTEEIDKLFEAIQQYQNIVLMIHRNPDGDAMGAALSFQRLLVKLNKKVNVIAPNMFPDFLGWMKGSEEIIIASEQFKLASQLIDQAELIVSMDFNSFSRLGTELEPLLIQSKAVKALIDHHLEPDLSFDILCSEIDTSSTCEIVFQLIKDSTYESYFDKYMAEHLYVGIATDTGSFSYNCNRPSTYDAISYLMKLGIDGEAIHRMVYDTYSENRMRLLGLCLSERLVVLPEFSASFIYLTKEDLKKYDYQTGDTEGVVNYGLSISGINITALFTERDNKTRISFRSKGEFDVNMFARTHYNGGGHRNASGADSKESLDETIQIFKEALSLYKNQLNF